MRKFERIVLITMSVISIVLLTLCITQGDKIVDLQKELELAKQDEELTREALITRNNDMYLCRMEAEEWKELFYAEIGFHPDESYPYK